MKLLFVAAVLILPVALAAYFAAYVHLGERFTFEGSNGGDKIVVLYSNPCQARIFGPAASIESVLTKQQVECLLPTNIEISLFDP